MSAALDFTYQYQHPSALVSGRDGTRLELTTCKASKEHPLVCPE